MSTVVYGQSQPAAEKTKAEKIKKDVTAVQKAVTEVIGLSIPGWGVLQRPNAAYLEGYGIVVSAEVAFDSPANPFTGVKSPEEVRSTATQRRKEVQEKLINILKQTTPVLESIAPTESVAIILSILNTNPAYMPEMPSQIVFSVKKQDAARTNPLDNIREYK